MALAGPSYSQEVQITLETAKKIRAQQIALSSCMATSRVSDLQLAKYKEALEGKLQENEALGHQVILLKNNLELMQVLNRSEKTKQNQPGIFKTVLTWLGIFATGYLVAEISGK
jgi:hypothetical protein